jgi:hypothetical protein
MKPLRERIARIIDPCWFDEIEGLHGLDNYPGQHKKYQQRALEKADEILSLFTNYIARYCPHGGRHGGCHFPDCVCV